MTLLDSAFGCRPFARSAAALLLASSLAACAPLTPQWDARFGDSVRAAIAQQTLNPNASRNTDPVAGIDGRAAHEAVTQYTKSFQEPPQPAPLLQILGGGRGK